MEKATIGEKRKSRIGPRDYKRNKNANRDRETAVGLVFLSMILSIIVMITSSTF